MTTIFIYARVSSEAQADNTSVGQQIANCRAWIGDEFGVEVPDASVFVEPGRTGANLERPEFQRLLAGLKTGALLAINTADRLTRNLDNLFQVRGWLKDAGARAYSVVEGLDITTVDHTELLRLMLQGWFSQQELERITYRMDSGRRVRMRQGEAAFGNTPPFGYVAVKRQMADGHTGTFLEIEPREADVVRLIFRLALEEERSSAAIARHLNALGIRSPAAWRGKASRGWYSSRVRAILSSSTYHGLYTWGEESIAVPAIVSEEQTLMARRRLAANVRFSPKNPTHRYLLTGLVHCDECTHTYTASTVGGHVYYGCEGRKHPTKYNIERCPAPHLPGRAIEPWVWGRVAAIIRDPALIEEYVSAQAESQAVNLEAELLMQRGRVESLERERVNLVRLRARGRVTSDAALNQALAEVAAELDASREACTDLETRRQQEQLWQVQARQIARRLEGLQAAVHQELPFDLKRAFLRELVDGVGVGLERVRIRIAAPQGEGGGFWYRTGCADRGFDSKMGVSGGGLVIEARLEEVIG